MVEMHLNCVNRSIRAFGRIMTGTPTYLLKYTSNIEI